jgi:diacylglycerol kinase family enzyme
VAAIAKRLVNSFDIVRVSDAFFISSLSFESPEKECHLYIDESFKIRAKVLGGKIINAQEPAGKSANIFSDPGDGRLEVVLAGKLSWFSAWRYRRKFTAKQFEALPGRSVLHARSLRILTPEGMPLYMGEYLIARTPASISVVDEKLRIVVGKNRVF